MTLTIKAFFFNAQRDYLPYYKQFSLEVGEEMAFREILPMIQAENRDFHYPEKQLYFRVNGLVMDGTQSIKTVTNRLGTQLQIDPVSAYRSQHGLQIDDSDFEQSFALLAPYATKADREVYESLYPLHYASETLNYNHQYIGDAILVLAAKMIASGNPHKTEILHAIASHHEGLWECEYENNLFAAEDHTEAITKLKEMAKGAPDDYKPFFARRYKAPQIEEIAGRNVAFYAGADEMSQSILESTLEQIESKGAKAIRFDKACKLAGQTLIKTHPKMAYLKMGTMLLDAFDNGADLLVVSSEEDATLFQKCIGYCEKVTQREIRLDIMPRGKLMGMAGKSVA